MTTGDDTGAGAPDPEASSDHRNGEDPDAVGDTEDSAKDTDTDAAAGPGRGRPSAGELDRTLAAVVRAFPSGPAAAEATRLSEQFAELARNAMPKMPKLFPDLPTHPLHAEFNRIGELAAELTRSQLPEPPWAAEMSRIGELAAQMTRSAMPEMPRLFADLVGDLPSAPLAAQFSRVSEMAAELSRSAVPDTTRLFADQLKVVDALTPSVLQRMELAATAELARSAFPNTGLETWRLSLLAEADVARLAGVRLPEISPALLDQLAARTSLAADLAERLATAAPGATMAAAATTTRAWGRYLALKPTAHRLQMSTVAGTTVGGLIGGDLLLHPAGADAEEVAEEVEQRLVEPWQTGPASARVELFAALRTIDVNIVAFIEGGWDDVQRGGSAAPSKIAHCVVEAVDHTLRALAPNDAVLGWLHRDGRQPAKGMLDQKGNATRPAKVAYVLRDRPGDRRLVQSQEQALGSLVGRVLDQAQGIKHAPGAATVLQGQMLLVTVEALLMQLVLAR